MSGDKETRSKRRHENFRACQKQVEIAKAHNIDIDTPHKYTKKHVMDCGNPKCFICGNPRKVFKEKTVQERRNEQSLED